MDIKRLNQIIGEGVGQASLCWQPRPTGVFESTEASKIVDEMRQQILEYIRDSNLEAEKSGYIKGSNDCHKAGWRT